ncbi:hypothetical protein POTOM_060135 [Populus tomentosa]|uniref:Uncharacterized protein n=1 Tax=Populus tomentosa TaxID=118781 RepID=A0A8X7XUA7_POPTO|nr:hypothetical protein POTOM_060135 [Populus tomentosa]
MLIQSFLSTSIECTPFHVSDQGKQDLFCDWMPGTENWQMCSKCHEHCHNCCKDAASTTEEKETNNYSCLLSFLRGPHPPTIIKMSESSAPSFVYCRRKLQGNSIEFLSAIAKRSGEDCPYVINSDGPSVAVKEHCVVSEDEHETGTVRVPLMPPVLCNGVDCSCPFSFGRSTQLASVSSVSKSAATNFVYGKTKLRQNSVSFLSAMAKTCGEDCLSVISSDGPSAARKEQRLISIHVCGAAVVPHPPVCNIADSPCPLSSQRSPQLPTVSTMSESSACNFVYSRKKLRGNSASFLSEQVPAMAKRSGGEDCLSLISSDGPSAARKEQCLICQHEHGAALMPPPTVYNKDDSPCQFCLQRSQLPTASVMSEISACNFIHSRRRMRGKSVTFLSAEVPGIMKRRREDCLSVISSDGPSLAVEEAHVVSQDHRDQHERGTGGALMPPPIAYNSEDSQCRLSLQGTPQLPTSSTMSEISAHNFVYSRRKLRGNSATFLSAQVPGITKRSREDCLSIISSDGPSLVVEEARVVSQDHQDQFERGTGGALPRPPLVCYGEPHVSKSESSSGCSLVEDLVSDEATKKSRPKIIEVDSINDSCSSSKSNMELVSDSTKTEGDDNGECSSSSIVAAEVTGEDQSENDQCISILRRQGAFEGVWPGKTHASAKSIGDGSGSGSSSSRPCKKCFRKGSPVKMLICDNCEDSFHVSCCNPRVKRIPVDEWLCRSCWKKKRIIPKETISRKSLNIIGDMGRCRDASSTGESNPIALMLRDSEPYTGGVRVGKGFQVDIPDWSGPIINDVDIIGKPLVLEPSYFVSLLELKSNKSSKLGSIGNWLQCKQVIDDAAEGGNVTICGKWRRAPLFEVQTAVWECFCCVFWDPIHADCAAPQELETDEVMKQIKYIQMVCFGRYFMAVMKVRIYYTNYSAVQSRHMDPWHFFWSRTCKFLLSSFVNMSFVVQLRPRIAAKHQKLRRASIGDPMDD